jgi:hypothetical protein
MESHIEAMNVKSGSDLPLSRLSVCGELKEWLDLDIRIRVRESLKKTRSMEGSENYDNLLCLCTKNRKKQERNCWRSYLFDLEEKAGTGSRELQDALALIDYHEDRIVIDYTKVLKIEVCLALQLEEKPGEKVYYVPYGYKLPDSIIFNTLLHRFRHSTDCFDDKTRLTSEHLIPHISSNSSTGIQTVHSTLNTPLFRSKRLGSSVNDGCFKQ